MNPYSVRQFVISIIIILVFFIYLIRLFYIQIIDSSYKYSAQNNSQRFVTQYPARGLVYDRNKTLLVSNEAAYDLMVNPQELRPFDTSALCNILGITKGYVAETIKKARIYSHYKSSPFLYQISDTTYASLQEILYQFPGFYVQPRTLRHYEYPIAAHLFGYVGEADSAHIKKEPYYQMGDYIGMSGMEKTYEKELRGKKGVNILLVDVHNRVKGSFQKGRYDTLAVMGKNLYSTIDVKLQNYGEKLMKRFRGSIVAIDPSTGEILTLVSSPIYNPQLLVGRVRSKNYGILRANPELPLFNRAIMAKYPPGSPFKLINCMIAQQEGLADPQTTFSCYRGYTSGPIHVGCHSHPSPLSMASSIQFSCNAYYCNIFRRIIEDPKFSRQEEAFVNWRKHVMSFGFGQRLNADFPNELSGSIPGPEYYDKYYGRNGWHSLTIISLAIGQGELGITPLQMANMAATIANRGYYYTPHIVKGIEGQDTISSRFSVKHSPDIDPRYFDIIVQGMQQAVNLPGGTAVVAALPNIIVCGKTGTAQNPHGNDHSIFIAFAPRDTPRIAISVYVENAGFGATYAGRIATLMIEKYLTDTITRPWIEDYLQNVVIDYSEKKSKHMD